MKKSLHPLISSLIFLPNRTPAMAFTGEGDKAFAEVAPFRDGAIYVGHYSGSSEWERHPDGDELVMVLSGTTTVVLLKNGAQERVALQEQELVVVPQGVWHRFDGSEQLQVLTITPHRTDHSLERPDA
jgi:mannose-6-phosphate isomerase-like protein (cupin superfamily)